jgi:Ni/Co efflux regulator RcnB
VAAVPVCSFAAVPQDHNDQHNNQKAAAHQNYHFRSQDKSKLQQHYRAAHHQTAVRNAHRWAWRRGENLPAGWQGQVEPLPQEDITLLAPPPPGYEFGYYNGWAIVYDPNTGVILDAVAVE